MFLIASCALLLTYVSFEYRDSDITVLIDDGSAEHVQPTREKIVGLHLRSLWVAHPAKS
jgi:hypothetical protein